MRFSFRLKILCDYRNRYLEDRLYMLYEQPRISGPGSLTPFVAAWLTFIEKSLQKLPNKHQLRGLQKPHRLYLKNNY